MLPHFYANFNSGPQAGKFITVYAGAPEAARRIVDVLDPALAGLRRNGVRPGPVPMNRQSGHTRPEEAVGASGMIFQLWLNDLRRG